MESAWVQSGSERKPSRWICPWTRPARSGGVWRGFSTANPCVTRTRTAKVVSVRVRGFFTRILRASLRVLPLRCRRSASPGRLTAFPFSDSREMQRVGGGWTHLREPAAQVPLGTLSKLKFSAKNPRGWCTGMLRFFLCWQVVSLPGLVWGSSCLAASCTHRFGSGSFVFLRGKGDREMRWR